MTITVNANIFPSALTFGAELAKETLQELVNLGTCAKVDNHQEHYAIQPCWISDPASGVQEEINHNVLGKWNNSLKGYVVAVKNIRNSERSAGINEDHRWLHVNITATYYTYTPEEGQRLKGEIKKIGNRAAICLLFDSFTATVFAKDEIELASWTIGDEVSFEIYSFVHRRKGPIIRAKSIGGSTKTKKKNFSQADFDDYEPLTTSNGVEYSDPVNQSLSEEEPQSSKKKKKKKKVKEEAEEYATQNTDLEDINFWGNESSGAILNQSENMDMDTTTESPRKKKSKIKIKQEPVDDGYDDGNHTDALDDINFLNQESLRAIQDQYMDPDDEESPNKKKKKKKKKSSHHE